MKASSLLDRFPQVFAGLSVLSLALVISSLVFAQGIQEFKRANDVLVITGSAKRPIKSDYIILRLSVSSQESTAKIAYQNLKTQIEQVQAYLKEQQVPDDAITLSAMRTDTIPEIGINGRNTGRILAYRLSQTLEIRSNEVERYADISQQATELINEGVNLVSRPPEYLYTKLSELRVEMVAEATKDAQARARAIASSTGNQVGAVRSARTGVFQITSRNSTAVSDYGIYDTSSLEKDITAVVSVQFAME
ncbi:MAG: SIMPL domain-containing protein [Xenococcaceae cyanobacterium MO_167.B52]|nr:SIMPL domain-containing protein [Xenococcaceae cyanobacterium MO_167.B52]